MGIGFRLGSLWRDSMASKAFSFFGCRLFSVKVYGRTDSLNVTREQNRVYSMTLLHLHTFSFTGEYDHSKRHITGKEGDMFIVKQFSFRVFHDYGRISEQVDS
jgi:hypothetical protein